MRSLGVIGVAVMAALSLSGCGLSLQQLPVGRSASGDAYLVTAQFERADQVQVGTEVRVGQETIGRVHDLSTDGQHAAVGLSLSRSVELPDNLTARVELQSALSKPFVRLTLPENPSPHTMTDGSVIPEDHTALGPELEKTLATLGLVMNGSGIDQLQTIMTEMNKAFSGRGPEVRTLLDRLDHTLEQATQHQDDLNGALDAANSVAAQLKDQQQVLDQGLAVAAPTIDLLVQQRDKITSLVDTTGSLATNANRILSQTSSELGGEADHLAKVLDSMQGFNTSVGPALTNMNSFLAGLSNAVSGDYLKFDGALQLPETFDQLMTGGKGPKVVVPPDLGAMITGGAR